ncbi:TPA: hypothetical protein MJA81_21975 [Klebsiella pneumoniae]|nr:hypothetical protein [Klebsiella pneumoniae]HBY9802970.1 hypothetical protein [Klebsiella pneumoniae]
MRRPLAGFAGCWSAVAGTAPPPNCASTWSTCGAPAARLQAGLRQRWTPEGWRRLDGAMRSTTARPDAQNTPHVQSTSRIERHHRRRSSAQRPHLQKARQKLELSNLVAVTSAVQVRLTMAVMGLHIDLREERPRVA